MNYKAITMHILNRIIILLIGFSLIILTSCNFNNNTNLLDNINQKKISNHILISGDSSNLHDDIANMIVKSDIRGGGYVVIIPTPDLKKDNNGQAIKEGFYKQQVMAVHILDINPVSEIKNSEIIAIENATIVCLAGNKSYKLRRITKNKKVIDAFKTAYKNGALITGIGTASSFICEEYLWFNVHPESHKVILESGLGLLKNTIIDEDELIRSSINEIQQLTTDSNYVFIGMSNDASVYINGTEGIILNGSSINVFSSFKDIRTLNDGNSFSIGEF